MKPLPRHPATNNNSSVDRANPTEETRSLIAGTIYVTTSKKTIIIRSNQTPRTRFGRHNNTCRSFYYFFMAPLASDLTALGRRYER